MAASLCTCIVLRVRRNVIRRLALNYRPTYIVAIALTSLIALCCYYQHSILFDIHCISYNTHIYFILVKYITYLFSLQNFECECWKCHQSNHLVMVKGFNPLPKTNQLAVVGVTAVPPQRAWNQLPRKLTMQRNNGRQA